MSRRRDDVLVGLDVHDHRSHWLPSSTWMETHGLITGRTGGGKSGMVISLLLQLARIGGMNFAVVDAKGELVPEILGRFLPTLDSLGLAPKDIVTFEPGQTTIPLGLLVRDPSMSVEMQAAMITGLLMRLCDGVGSRMRVIANWLCRACIEAGANLLDLRRILDDEGYQRALLARVADPEVRHYLQTSFPNESAASREALRARLDLLLLLPRVRASLCAPTCLRGPDLIESPWLLADLGSGIPVTCPGVREFLGTLLLFCLVSAAFERPNTPKCRPVLLVVDEWQSMVSFAADDFDTLLSRVRFKGVSMALVNQSLGQISDAGPKLMRCLRANIGYHALFRCEVEDLPHLRELVPTTGAMKDPRRPGLLSVAAERDLYLGELCKLPKRMFVYADFDRGRTDVLRTPELPYRRAGALASALSPRTRESWRLGAHATLTGSPPAPTLTPAPEGPERDREGEPRSPTSRSSSPRSRRPRLELP